MGRLKWYKRDPDAALSGMFQLSLEERGAYNTVLDLIYSRDGELPDDDRWIAGWMRCDVRVWRRIKARLIEAGKLYVSCMKLRNQRADVEVLRGLSMVASKQEAGRTGGIKSGHVRRENKDLAEANAKQTTNTTTATTTSRNKTPKPPAAAPPGFDDFWSVYPRKIGKGAAVKAYAAAIKKIEPCDLLTATYVAASAFAKVDPKFIPHPTTWLNREQWLDEPARSNGAAKRTVFSEFAS